ncbi:PhzF family phenazine biosynthesis protein [Streptomyces sp. FXJ1.172]|uniref:PhzF family phenazine biosynthesis protein n=1 Tax=Streptomyces sp. FXJ1.172 TaxID=710705 RepID=UPI0007CF3874|nr:PhzF family phenazine biosynthesis protein [Streptomyces sp. FXJ1.172]WEO93502.1 PhzF family phenazine biosynthesis protein [Streptomyces sp. FXJ1.172]
MRIHVVDAFTDRPFTGNPAAVCLLPPGQWPEDAWMLRIAAEMNHSETAFALPTPAGAEADWAIRWFTPLVESRLCGHATLATAHVLRAERGLVGTVRFMTRWYGVLVTHADEEGGITMDFPAAPSTAVPVPDGLSQALGSAPEDTFRSDGLGDLLAVLPDEATVRGASPDMNALAALTHREGLRGVIITAPAAGTGLEHDFVSRFFAPARGIPEDPVTGSAHTVLAPYWSARLGRDELTGLQASARPGLVRTAVHGDRVHLTGKAVTVLDCALHARPAPGGGS